MLLLAAMACGDASASAPEVARTIEVARVREAVSDERISLHGVVESAGDARLAFTVGGRLASRVVDIGDRVEAGQILARLDARPFQNAVASAAATLAQLQSDGAQRRRDARRATLLEASGAVGASSAEGARSGAATVAAAERGAQAGLREARRQRSEAVLRAPTGGVVTAVFADPGTVVNPGAPILAFSAQGGAEVWVRLPARRLPQIDIGAAAQLAREIGEGCEARVEQVARAADGTGLFPVRLRADGCAGLVVGESVLAQIRTRSSQELRVPLRAVLDPAGDSPFLWREAGGVVERCPIRVLGLRGESEVAVRGVECALSSGDAVVTEGRRHVFAGDRLEASADGRRVLASVSP